MRQSSSFSSFEIDELINDLIAYPYAETSFSDREPLRIDDIKFVKGNGFYDVVSALLKPLSAAHDAKMKLRELKKISQQVTPEWESKESTDPILETCSNELAVEIRIEFVDKEKTSGRLENNDSKQKRCFKRNNTMLAWYEDRELETHHSPTKIRDLWNKENPGNKISGGKKGVDTVKKAIKKAKENCIKVKK